MIFGWRGKLLQIAILLTQTNRSNAMVSQGSTSTIGTQKWRTSGVKKQGPPPTRTEFPPELVAQLREAQKNPRKPWQPPASATVMVEPTTAVNEPPTAVNEPPTAVADTDPAPSPALPLLPTMADIQGGNLTEKAAFVRRHFPAWLAYQKEHGLSRSKMLALTGVSSSVWHNHKIQYEAHPERYGEAGLLPPKPKQKHTTVVLGDGLPLPEALSPLSSTAVDKMKAFMLLAQELRQMGATVQASVSWQVDVTL
jgi:hypothetical protein